MSNSFRLGMLEQLIDFRNGKAIQKTDGSIPIYGGNGILGYTDKSNYENTLIIGRVGAYCGSVHIEKNKCWVSDNAIAGLPKNGNNNEYNYYFLKSLRLNEQRIGSSQPLLTQGILNNVQVKIQFDPIQQAKIAAVLSALDAKIACNNRINAELEAMAKTLYDYWFVQFDFPYDFAQGRPDPNGKPYRTSGGKMVYNPTLKREIPEGWEDKQLSQIANIMMGHSPLGESLNQSKDGVEFFQGSTDFGWQFPTVRQYTTQVTRMAKRGDLLLSVRAPVGDMNIANIDCCIGRGLAALNSKEGFDGFLFYVMRYFKTIFDRRNGEGTTFGSITKDDLHSLPLAYPPIELLKEYDKIVARQNQMVFIRSIENQHLTQLRDWLLPMLMNGQVTVA